VVRSLYHHHQEKVQKYLRTEKGKFRIFLANDPELGNKVKSLPGARPNKTIFLEDNPTAG
jgi:hypothetical protein